MACAKHNGAMQVYLTWFPLSIYGHYSAPLHVLP